MWKKVKDVRPTESGDYLVTVQIIDDDKSEVSYTTIAHYEDDSAWVIPTETEYGDDAYLPADGCYGHLSEYSFADTERREPPARILAWDELPEPYKEGE